MNSPPPIRTSPALGGVLAEFLRIEHSILALPFVLVGFLVGLEASGRTLSPTLENMRLFALTLVAAVSARVVGMTANRIIDREIDRLNPRTSNRALPRGALSLRSAYLLGGTGAVLFLAACAALNPFVLALSPVALALLILYPYTKRWTWGCHFVLGLTYFVATAGGYLAVTGGFPHWEKGLFFGVAAALWVSGFDILYALLDEEWDRAHGIHSLPSDFGGLRARWVARALHGGYLLSLGGAGVLLPGGWAFLAALGVNALLLLGIHTRGGADPATSPSAFIAHATCGWSVLVGTLSSLTLGI